MPRGKQGHRIRSETRESCPILGTFQHETRGVARGHILRADERQSAHGAPAEWRNGQPGVELVAVEVFGRDVVVDGTRRILTLWRVSRRPGSEIARNRGLQD